MEPAFLALHSMHERNRAEIAKRTEALDAQHTVKIDRLLSAAMRIRLCSFS